MLNKELSNYLKTKKGLNRLMIALKNKYVTLSRPSGTVILNNITNEESIDISNLLGKKVDVNSNLKTSFKEITKKINEGKYASFDWIELFNYYFDEKIITKEVKKSIAKNDETAFFEQIFKQNKKYTDIVKDIIINNANINKIIKKKYHQNKNQLRIELNNILLLLNNIPTTPTPLAVYASQTGNPHYLDFNKNTSNLFMRLLAIIKNIEYKDNAETKINILSEINVYTDPISNYVITYKLIGNKILNELSTTNEVVNLNLLNINNIDRLDTKDNQVYVFENPSILSSLKELNVPIIITSGNPNISVYEVIKKISKNNKIYYNGDFDPEGLIIAQKLKEKFENLQLFCYDKIDYNNCKSNSRISDSRLKKLDNVERVELKEIKNLLLLNKIPGYQEQNIDRIKEYINKNKK